MSCGFYLTVMLCVTLFGSELKQYRNFFWVSCDGIPQGKLWSPEFVAWIL
jgi:hypothetical protein